MCGILLYFDFPPPLHLAPFVSSCFWISFDPLTNGATTAAVVVAFCFMSFLRIVHLFANCCFLLHTEAIFNTVADWKMLIFVCSLWLRAVCLHAFTLKYAEYIKLAAAIFNLTATTTNIKISH